MGGSESTPTKPTSTNDRTQNATDDFANLLGDEKYSDVMFIIANGTAVLRAHKAILAARSKVLANMLESEMSEKLQNMVYLPDINANVMSETLRYIYTGRVENIQSIADELLIVADKYMLDGLKVMCVDAMIETMTNDNVILTLQLPEMYDIERLKTSAKDFIRKNVKCVIKTDAFQALKDSNSTLLNDLYCDLAMNYKE